MPFALGAFNQGPVDVYQPTYNLAYGEFASQRPNFKYIDAQTGQERDYEKVYIPEADPKKPRCYENGALCYGKNKIKNWWVSRNKKI